MYCQNQNCRRVVTLTPVTSQLHTYRGNDAAYNHIEATCGYCNTTNRDFDLEHFNANDMKTYIEAAVMDNKSMASVRVSYCAAMREAAWFDEMFAAIVEKLIPTLNQSAVTFSDYIDTVQSR